MPGASRVAAKHGRRQTEFVVIGHSDGFLNPVHTHDGFDRGKRLFAVNRHLGRDMVQQRRRHQRVGGFAAADQRGALGQRIVNQRIAMRHRRHVDHGTQHNRPFARVAQRQALGLRGQLGDKLVSHRRIDHDAFGGHADLPRIGKSAKRGSGHGSVDISIVQHQKRRFSAQFQHGLLEVLGAGLRNDLADAGGAGEVDAAHRRMRHHGFDHRAGIGRGIGDKVDHTGRKTGFLQRFNDQSMRGGADFRAFENHRVAASQRRGNRPHRQNDGRVPRRNAQHHASRLTHRQGQVAGHIRRDHFATDLRRDGGGFQQHASGQMHVEAGPDAGGTGFSGHGGGKRFAFGFQRLCRFHQQRTSLARNHGGPGRKGFGGGVYRRSGVVCRGGGRARGNALVQRVAALEGGTVGSGTRSAANQHLNVVHGGLSRKMIVGAASPTLRHQAPA